jgi:hypothetical protein
VAEDWKPKSNVLRSLPSRCTAGHLCRNMRRLIALGTNSTTKSLYPWYAPAPRWAPLRARERTIAPGQGRCFSS